MKKTLLFFIFLAFNISCFSQVVLLEEYFNDTINLPASWTTIDQDGDNHNWRINTWDGGTVFESYAVSDSWYDDTVLTPENYLVSPHINLTNLTGTVKLRYTIQIANEDYPAEHYKVALSTGSNHVGSFTNILLEETTTVAEYYIWVERIVDLTPFIGNNIYLTWCHFECTDMYKLLLDSIQVTNTPDDGIINNQQPYVLVYPNPANEKLMVKGDFENAQMQIFTSEGQQIYQSTKVTGQIFIDISGFEKGVYILRIESSKGIITKKVNIIH